MVMKQARGRKAFTLVELLVVISIIALLLSILMPSLHKAREVAKRAVCMSNLKQLSIGSVAYGLDNKHLPYFVNQGETNYKLYIDHPSYPNPKGWVNLGLLYDQKYISDAKCFYCPSDKQHTYKHYFPAGGMTLDYYSVRCSYIVRNLNPDIKKGSFTDSRGRFDRKAWLAASVSMKFGSKFAFLADRWTYDSGCVHEKRFYNTMYADGHVGTVKDTEDVIRILGNIMNEPWRRGELPEEYISSTWDDAWKVFDEASF